MNQHTRLKRRMARKWPKHRLRRVRIFRTWWAETGESIWLLHSEAVAGHYELANRLEERGEIVEEAG